MNGIGIDAVNGIGIEVIARIVFHQMLSRISDVKSLPRILFVNSTVLLSFRDRGGLMGWNKTKSKEPDQRSSAGYVLLKAATINDLPKLEKYLCWDLLHQILTILLLGRLLVRFKKSTHYSPVRINPHGHKCLQEGHALFSRRLACLSNFILSGNVQYVHTRDIFIKFDYWSCLLSLCDLVIDATYSNIMCLMLVRI